MKIFSVFKHLRILILRVLQGLIKGLLTQSHQSQTLPEYYPVIKSYETFTLKLLIASSIRTIKNRVPVHDGFTVSK